MDFDKDQNILGDAAIGKVLVAGAIGHKTQDSSAGASAFAFNPNDPMADTLSFVMTIMPRDGFLPSC